MFTGLIEKVGRLAGIHRDHRGVGGYRLRIEHTPWDTPLAVGDSVAVGGVCLTATSAELGAFTADLLEETVKLTSMREREGKSVNLERAVRADSRFGGHFVTGHVDGVGSLDGIAMRGRDRVLTVRCSGELLAEMVMKGSIACDGVSLTIVRLDGRSFDVHIIPHTWDQTALSDLAVGSCVHLETDIVGKYVRRAIAPTPNASGLSVDDLVKAGIFQDHRSE